MTIKSLMMNEKRAMIMMYLSLALAMTSSIERNAIIMIISVMFTVTGMVYCQSIKKLVKQVDECVKLKIEDHVAKICVKNDSTIDLQTEMGAIDLLIDFESEEFNIGSLEGAVILQEINKRNNRILLYSRIVKFTLSCCFLVFMYQIL